MIGEQGTGSAEVEPDPTVQESSGAAPDHAFASAAEGEVDDIEESSADTSEASLGVRMEVGSILGDGTTVVGRIEEHFNIRLEQRQEGADALDVQLGSGHFTHHSLRDIHQEAAEIVINEAEIQRLSAQLQDHGWILLEGSGGIGKTRMALMVALQAGRRLELDDVKVCQHPPGEDLVVDLLAMATHHEMFERSIVIFRNVFHRRNKDLLRFVQRGDAIALRNLREKLKGRGSLLILTNDAENRPPAHGDFVDRVQHVEGPQQPEILAYLSRRSTYWIERTEKAGEIRQTLLESFDRLVEAEGTRIVEHLGGIGNVEQFVRFHLLDVLRSEQVELTLEHALRANDQLDGSFLDQLTDLESLAHCLALLISQSGPPGHLVRWWTFEKLVAEMRKILRALAPGERDRRVDQLLAQEALLERFGVMVDEDDDGPILRFRDEQQGERLWTLFLGPGRSLMALLESELRRLCQSKDVTMRQFAAWSLARLSHLDPKGLAINLMKSWIQSKKAEAQRALGIFLQGIASTASPRLKTHCYNHLREELSYQTIGHRKLSALAALGDLGRHDLDVALQEVQGVVERDLIGRLDGLKTQDFFAALPAVDISRALLPGRTWQRLELDFNRRLEGAFGELFGQDSQESKLVADLQFVLVGLVFDQGARGAAPVAQRLDGWVQAGREKEGLGPFMALSCWRSRGVLEILQRHPVETSVGGDVKVDRFLASILHDEETLPTVVSFLFKLYLSSRWFAPGLVRGLNNQFLYWLARRIQESVDGPGRPVLLRLWAGLMSCPDKRFRGQLQSLLEQVEPPLTRSPEFLPGYRKRSQSLLGELRSAGQDG